MTKEKITFSFGENWKNYLDGYFNERRLQMAKNSIKEFLNFDLKGKIFMDIGCGSGLFSLCAYEMGAGRVISFDADPLSVECCSYLRKKKSSPKNWAVLHGSVLDENFLKKLPQADIAYSLGVLHHTGQMWDAIKNASSKVRKGGYLYISIYNKKPGIRGSKNQLKLKKLYNLSPRTLKKLFEYGIISQFFLKNILFLKNPYKLIKEKEKNIFNRGMSFKIDVIDWLGGLPYEFATPQEIFDFCSKKLGLQLVNVYMVDERNSLGNNHYLFKKPE